MSTRKQQRMMAATLAGFVLLAAGWAQPAADGKALFQKRCGGCHALDRDKEGPRLGAVYGRAAGSLESFAYSDALKNSRIVWNDQTLDRWLVDTEELVPDNNMTFRVEKAEERLAIIAFLKRAANGMAAH